MRIFLSKIIDWLLVVFLFLLPWQTRWIWQQGEINGAPWEYGTYSLYGTEILLWLIIILFAINKFGKKEIWKKVISSAHYQTHKKYLFFAVGFIIFLATSVLLSKNVWLSYNYVFYLLGGLCLFVILSNTVVIARSKIPHFVSGQAPQSFCLGIATPLKGLAMTSIAFRMAIALWLGGVVQGLLALWQFLAQFVYGNKWLGMATQNPRDLGVAVIEFGDERWLRAYGSFGWPNSLGIYLAVLLVLGVILQLSLRGGQSPTRQSFKIRDCFAVLAMTVGQIIITIGLVLSFSRSAWLAAVVGLAGLLVVLARNETPHFVSGQTPQSLGWEITSSAKSLLVMTVKQIFFIILPVLCLFFIFQPVFLARFNPQNRLENRSLTERQEQYAEFKQIFFSHPWMGAGPGAYTLALAEKYPEAKAYGLQPVHNIYLLTLAEWGIIGAMIWLFIFGFLGGRIWENNKIFLPVILVLLVAGLFDHWALTLYSGIILWWIIWGFSVAKSK